MGSKLFTVNNCFSVSNPLNMDEFRDAVIKLHHDFDAAISRERDNQWRIGYKAYRTNLDKILAGYLTAKHQLYEERSKAQCDAKVFSNVTAPVDDRSTVDKLLDSILDEPTVDQILDEISERNKDEFQFKDHDDEIAEIMRNYAEIMQLDPTNNHMMQLNDTENCMKVQSTRGHYHCGLASTFGTMFGMLIAFLLFIVFKKFKQRNDPVKSTLL